MHKKAKLKVTKPKLKTSIQLAGPVGGLKNALQLPQTPCTFKVGSCDPALSREKYMK